jgi:fructoselysine-6-P-deglycase FrlB-like protein
VTRDRYYDFLNTLAEKFGGKMAFVTQNKAKICKILIITLVFEKNANFFCQKLSKIAENCDHNIDPRMGEIVQLYTYSILFYIEAAQTF